jgi:hypothetical protein
MWLDLTGPGLSCFRAMIAQSRAALLAAPPAVA